VRRWWTSPKSGGRAEGRNDPAGNGDGGNSTRPVVADRAVVERERAEFERSQVKFESQRVARDRRRALLESTYQYAVEPLDRARIERELATLEREQAAADREQAEMNRAQTERIIAAASHDDLTGALRRDAGFRRLEEEINRARRSRHSIVLVFVDVDGLKRVNDRLGHMAGDDVLRAVVAELRNSLRSYDLIIRFGGDEFLCVLVDASANEARAHLEDVERDVSSKVDGASISFGLTELEASDDVGNLIARADFDMMRQRALRRRAHR
jgi:diguanylate cyclase (GGDEF)-like protein